MANKRIDLTGQQFGDLTVIKLSDKRNEKHNNTRMWECLCSCGNTVYLLGFSLIHGHYKSCGCRRAEKLVKGLQEHIKDDRVDGTRKTALKTKIYKTNKSGYKGVTWNKQRNKWRATIGFKGKQIFLGNYDNKEDAIKARQLAEEKLHKPILEDNKNEKR